MSDAAVAGFRRGKTLIQSAKSPDESGFPSADFVSTVVRSHRDAAEATGTDDWSRAYSIGFLRGIQAKSFDYLAHFADYDLDDPIGYGATEKQAVEELKEWAIENLTDEELIALGFNA